MSQDEETPAADEGEGSNDTEKKDTEKK